VLVPEEPLAAVKVESFSPLDPWTVSEEAPPGCMLLLCLITDDLLEAPHSPLPPQNGSPLPFMSWGTSWKSE